MIQSNLTTSECTYDVPPENGRLRLEKRFSTRLRGVLFRISRLVSDALSSLNQRFSELPPPLLLSLYLFFDGLRGFECQGVNIDKLSGESSSHGKEVES